MRNKHPSGSRLVAALAIIALMTPLLATAAGAELSYAGDDMELTSIDAGLSGGRELPAMSADGNRVVFVGRGEGTGVWLRERTRNQTYKLTTVPSGSSGHFNPAISADGETVAYVQYGADRQVYVIDITDPAAPSAPELVSRNAANDQGTGQSDYPSLSGDGRYVAFNSTLTTLDPSAPPAGSGGPNKVYVRDRMANDTFIVSILADGSAVPGGNAVKPDITPDGTQVVFASEQDLAVPPASPTATQVWKATIAAGDVTAMELISRTAGGAPGDAGSSLIYGPTISDDGTTVAFESAATNLVAGDANGDFDAFVAKAGTITRISVDQAGSQVDLPVQVVNPCDGSDWLGEDGLPLAEPPIPIVGAGPVVSGDGSYVAFESDAVLTADDLNDSTTEFGTVRVTDVYGYDLLTGAVQRVSQAESPDGVEATGCRTDGHTGTLGEQNNGVDAAIGRDRLTISFVSNGDLAGERPVSEEEPHEVTAAAEEEETSTEAAIHTRTYQAAFVDDATIVEPDTGTRNVQVRVRLKIPAKSGVTVGYQTSNLTALAGRDYVSTAGTVTFGIGELEKLVPVPVLGDFSPEPDRTFQMTLSDTEALLGRATATITIQDNDKPVPTMYRRDQVWRLYVAAFDRKPDAAGLAYWVGTPLSVTQIAGYFVASPEFLVRYGNLTNKQFVEQLYLNVLHRPGETAGVTYWTNLLNTGTSRAVVLTQFANSDELIRTLGGDPTAPNSMERADQIHRLYEAAFNREPDAAGLAYWVGTSLTPGQIAELFVVSPEFVKRYGTLTNAAFVQQLYLNVLGRPGETPGVTYWTNLLNTGTSRGTVLLGFANSYELAYLLSLA